MRGTTSRRVNRPTLGFVPTSARNLIRRTYYGSVGLVARRGRWPRFVIVVGHMRTGSTLLSRILADESANLDAGRILQHDERLVQHVEVDLADRREELASSYETCVARLREHCRTVR